MSIDGINANFQATMNQGTTQAASGEAARGVFMGHTVKVDASPASLLSDAAEELGFSVDKTKDYDLSRRKEKRSSEINEKLLERYMQMLQQAGKGEAVDQFVRTMKTHEETESMRQALSEAFGDPTDAWAALQEALSAFDKDPSILTHQKKALEALAQDYWAENASAIKLGLQGALTGADYADVGDLGATRDFYRQTVGEFSSVNEVFSEIKAKYGPNFDRAMDFLFAAISSDIGGENPSMEKAHLESIHTKLGIVRLTQSAFTILTEMLGRWETVHGMKNCPVKPMDLLGDIMDLRTQSYLGASAIDRIADKAKAPDPEFAVLYRQELLTAVRKFPVDLFDSLEGRNNFMSAVQASVDDAIEREDEWLASME